MSEDFAECWGPDFPPKMLQTSFYEKVKQHVQRAA